MIVQFLHLSSYGILLGSQVFQTFINGIVAFKALGRPYFGVHQAALFPVYFSLQTFLPVLVGLTSTCREMDSGWVMGVVMVTGLVNLVVFRPLTQGAVRVRNAQELRDKKMGSWRPSKELVACNRRFTVIHASSIFINVVGLLATVHYGLGLGMRLS